MTALAAAGGRKRRAMHLANSEAYAVGTSSTIYQGSLVVWNKTTKRAVAATVATGRRFLGVAENAAVGGTATATAVYVKVLYGHEELLDAASALTGAYVGCNAAIADDNQVTTMSGAGTALLRIRVGEVLSIESGDAWTRIRSFSEIDV